MMEHSIATRLAMLRGEVAAAAELDGRQAGDIRIMLATKTQSAERILEAFAAGSSLIGENRVQELVAKAAALAGHPHELHLIGPLQRNKINAALREVDCVQSVDGIDLARQLSAKVLVGIPGRTRPLGDGKLGDGKLGCGKLGVFVQVNVSGETSKSGCAPEQAADMACEIAALPGLQLRGFMTVGLNSPDLGAVAAGYARLRDIRDEVVVSGNTGTAQAVELSMGMSGDYVLAIHEGATMIRVGSLIFGARDSVR